MFVRLNEWLRRPVPRGQVFLSYLGIIVAIGYGASVGAYTDGQLERTDRQLVQEAEVREAQICGVVINVHKNARFRARTEQNRVMQTVDYLIDPTAKRDALYKRISANLPQVRQDRDVAQANVEATKPPPICSKYEEK